MSFNAVEEIKSLALFIEGKLPTDLEDYFNEKVELYGANGIHSKIHVGETDWTLEKAAEWLLGMFIGIHQKGKEDSRYYNAHFPVWMSNVQAIIVENKMNLT